MPKLTKTVVEKAQPHPEHDVFIWDHALPGFGLRIYPSGTRKYVYPSGTRKYVAQYRMPD